MKKILYISSIIILSNLIYAEDLEATITSKPKMEGIITIQNMVVAGEENFKKIDSETVGFNKDYDKVILNIQHGFFPFNLFRETKDVNGAKVSEVNNKKADFFAKELYINMLNYLDSSISFGRAKSAKSFTENEIDTVERELNIGKKGLTKKLNIIADQNIDKGIFDNEEPSIPGRSQNRKLNLYADDINIEVRKNDHNLTNPNELASSIFQVTSVDNFEFNIEAKDKINLFGDIFAGIYDRSGVTTSSNSSDVRANINQDESSNPDVNIVGNIITQNVGTLGNNKVKLRMNTKNSSFLGFILDMSGQPLKEDEGTILDISNGASVKLLKKSINNKIKENIINNVKLYNGGITDTTYEDKYMYIYINNLRGNGGIINLKIDASAKRISDGVVIENEHEGIHYIKLKNIGTEVDDNIVGKKLIWVLGEENGEFRANDEEGTLYWDKYTLAKNTEDPDYKAIWYIDEVKPQDKPTTITNAIVNSSKVNKHLFTILDNDYLQKRMGNLKLNSDENNNVWSRLRIFKGSDENISKTSILTELGYDKNIRKDEKGLSYLGASLHYLRNNSLHNDVNEVSNAFGIKGYYTRFNNNGIYYDIVARLSNVSNKYEFTFKNNKVNGSYNSIGASLSGELGYKLKVTDNFRIEPEIQGILSYEKGPKYTLSNDVNVSQKSNFAFTGRLGLRGVYTFKDKLSIYAKLDMYNKFTKDVLIGMEHNNKNKEEKYSIKNIWLEYGAGISYQNTKNLKMYLELLKSNGFNANLGIRYSW